MLVHIIHNVTTKVCFIMEDISSKSFISWKRKITWPRHEITWSRHVRLLYIL